MNLTWYMIDAIGPFFRYSRAPRINWSKIPFRDLETNGRLTDARRTALIDDFSRLTDQFASLGFNAITLDDLPHLLNQPFYPDELRFRLDDYSLLYDGLLARARERHLATFITTDIMFFNESLRQHIGRGNPAIHEFLEQQLDQLFSARPDITGLILRIGETDGLDVKGDFHSQLVIRRPRQATQLIQALLPVCERHQRELVFRTWSVGAYPIGDLMWNRDTWRAVFDPIRSDRFLISLKYGESDFFRHLPISKHFFRSEHRKIVELQTRREYEGMGEYPSFIGNDYAAYRDALRGCHSLAGIMVWCQTGGWSGFRRLSFLQPEGIWNECNTVTTLALFKDDATVEAALDQFRRSHLPDRPLAPLLEFFNLSEAVVKNLLYVRDFAQRKIYFRRLRVPPLLTAYWDHILITHAHRRLLRMFTESPNESLREATTAMTQLRRMRVLAGELRLPVGDIDFQIDTYAILVVARRYFFEPFSEERCADLLALIHQYRRQYRHGYAIMFSMARTRFSGRQFRLLLALCFRHKRGYRMADHIVTIRLLSWFFFAFKRFGQRLVPDFARKQAMGLDSILR